MNNLNPNVSSGDWDLKNTSVLFYQQPMNATNENTLSAISVSITALSLMLNCGALADLVIQKTMRAPFMLYVIVLLCSNIVYLGIHGTVLFLTNSLSNWRIGNQVCSLHIYNRYIINPVVLHIHLMIGLNRGWALTFPISYKTVHTFKFAWIICLAMILYIHICQLPGFILDAVYYRLPVDKGCWVNAKQQFAWEVFTTVWIYSPKLLIPLSYPFLVWKWVRMRIARSSRSVVTAESIAGQSGKVDSQPTAAPRRTERDHTRPFVMLTFMTITTMVTWTPSFVYYGMVRFGYPASRLATLNTVQGAVSPFQALVDPLIFCLGNSSMYAYVSRIRKRRIMNQKVTPAV